MDYTMTFREVTDPKNASETGKYDWFGSFSHIPVRGIPHGGLIRFTEEFEAYLKYKVPDFYLGDDLNVFHPVLSREVVGVSINRIRDYCIGWAGYDEIDKTPA